jgi:hypothetical protein
VADRALGFAFGRAFGLPLGFGFGFGLGFGFFRGGLAADLDRALIASVPGRDRDF